jgi:bacterioferritin-associated ferredoxin
MRCSFCDTEGHHSLRVVPVPSAVKRTHSTTSDMKASIGYGGACDGCLEMIREALNDATPSR